MTCLRRLREWQQSGVWPKIRHMLGTRLQQAHRIDWARADVDARDTASKQRQRRRPGFQLVAHGRMEAARTGETVVDGMKCMPEVGAYAASQTAFATGEGESGVAN